MDLVDNNIEKYVESLSDSETPILKEISEYTLKYVHQPRMLSGHLQGRILSFISKIISPKNILEIGTYTGYSAICLCEGMKEEGKLHTIDINEELKEMSSKYFKKANIDDKIVQHVGNALKIIPELDLNWDLVFIDADKENYSCLLYTSPSPRDATLSRMPSSA